MSDQEVNFIQNTDEEPPSEGVTSTTHREGDPLTVIPASQKSTRGGRGAAGTAAPVAEAMARVKLLNTDEYGENRLVIDLDTKEVYLVPNSKLEWTVKEQRIAKRDLESAERPYNLDTEIASLLTTPQELRIALWSMGVVTEDAARSLGLRETVARMLMKGVLPVVSREE